jgi:unconventional prefoldin RPB5 interactor 1
MDSAVLERVEAQRLALEANIDKLRKSLRHWQNLELDYEGLQEEFGLLPENASREQCLQTARDFKAVIVDESDLQTLLKDTAANSGSPKRLANILSKRVDYVSRNADTIRKQIISEEKKLNALLLAEDPDTRDDAGLPLTEITEELDDAGNVVSTKVEVPGTKTSELVNVLAKAGVEGLKTSGGKVQVDHDKDKQSVPGKDTAPPAQMLAQSESGVDESSEDSSDDEQLASRDRPVKVPVPGENPIAVTFRDTLEEAQLRREMLEYGLNEVGAIVAELDLQEGVSDVSYDEDDDNLDIDSDFDNDDDDLDASEDEYGRVKNPQISDKYKQKMADLEKRLGLTDLKNLGPDPELPENVREALDRPPAAEAARGAAIARANATSDQQQRDSRKPSAKSAKKKSVVFASDLDISATAPSSTSDKSAKSAAKPIGDAIVERSGDNGSDAPAPPAPAPSARPSHFKAAREAANAIATSSPSQSSTDPGKQRRKPTIKSSKPADRPLIAPQVLERDTASDARPPDPDDIDDELHRREIAMDYHRIRNRRIHARGGFVRDPADEGDDEMDEMLGNNVMVDEETGEVKKVSRFKAARLMR